MGHRLGQEQIDRILPIFLRFTDPKDAITGDDEDADDDARMNDASGDGGPHPDQNTSLANELRESCFSGYESFILKCQNEVGPHWDRIITACLAYASYDPNYSYGNDEETDDNCVDEDGDDGDEEEEPKGGREPSGRGRRRSPVDSRSVKKICSSCGTKKTPYWREGWEPSITLCNACGIRYHKYKKFCTSCIAIARKDEKGRLHCPGCLLRL